MILAPHHSSSTGREASPRPPVRPPTPPAPALSQVNGTPLVQDLASAGAQGNWPDFIALPALSGDEMGQTLL